MSSSHSTAHLPPTGISITDPESAASLRVSIGQPRFVRAGNGGGGTWRTIQAKPPRSRSIFPISIAPIRPAVFLDGGLRTFDDTEQVSFLLTLPNLQRSPQLFLTIGRIVQACCERLKEDDPRPLTFPNPLWMRVDAAIRSAPIKDANGTTTLEPLAAFRKRPGYYFLDLQVAGLHLPASGENWTIKIRVTDFMLTDAPNDLPSDSLSLDSRIQAPPPLPPSSSRLLPASQQPPTSSEQQQEEEEDQQRMPPPPAPYKPKIARLRSKPGPMRETDAELEEMDYWPPAPSQQPLSFNGSPTSEADDEETPSPSQSPSS